MPFIQYEPESRVKEWLKDVSKGTTLSDQGLKDLAAC